MERGDRACAGTPQKRKIGNKRRKRMRHIGEVRDQELAWTQTGYCHGEYELQAGDEVVATLHWRGGSLAIAETADGCWSFELPGFRRSRVSIRTAGSGTEIAVFRSSWTGGGTLELAGGRLFHWSATNLWRSRWVWLKADGTALVSLRSRQRLKLSGLVERSQAAAALPEFGLLVTLGWYLLVRAQVSTTDAVAATAGTAGS
jgi:hypothetical protein